MCQMKHFDDYQQYEAREDRMLRKTKRKSKKAAKKERRADKIEPRKPIKAERKRESARKVRARRDAIIDKFNDKGFDRKYKIKALNKLIVGFTTSKRNKRIEGDKEGAANMAKVIGILKLMRSRLQDNDLSQQDFDSKIEKIANLAALIEKDKDRGSILKQINSALDEAEDKGTITEPEKAEAIRKGEEKIDGKSKDTETEREVNPLTGKNKTFDQYREIFKGLETAITAKSAPLLSKTNKQKGVAQFLQMFLNDLKHYSVKEAVQLIEKEGNVDGYFGEITEDALKAYQKSKGIPETGKTDKETWKAIYTDVELTMDEDFKVVSSTAAPPVSTETQPAGSEVPSEEVDIDPPDSVGNITLDPKKLQAMANSYSNSPQFKTDINNLVTQGMWQTFTQTDEAVVYGIITSKVITQELNTYNIAQYLQAYKTTADSTDSGSGGLIEDIIDSFDTGSGRINRMIKDPGFEPVKQLRETPDIKFNIITWFKHNYTILYSQLAWLTQDTKMAAEICFYIGLMNNPTAVGVLTNAGIDMKFILEVRKELVEKLNNGKKLNLQGKAEETKPEETKPEEPQTGTATEQPQTATAAEVDPDAVTVGANR